MTLTETGRDDSLIGAPYHDSGGADAGAVYLLYGPPAGNLDLSGADARILGAAAVDRVEIGDAVGQLVVHPHVPRHRRTVVGDLHRVAQQLARRHRVGIVRLVDGQIRPGAHGRQVGGVVVAVVVVEHVGGDEGVVLEDRAVGQRRIDEGRDGHRNDVVTDSRDGVQAAGQLVLDLARGAGAAGSQEGVRVTVGVCVIVGVAVTGGVEVRVGVRVGVAVTPAAS